MRGDLRKTRRGEEASQERAGEKPPVGEASGGRSSRGKGRIINPVFKDTG